ncbi:hypothetical protein KY331_04690 [Candidatus Woesearchaeota archaeon]|nr:hypothetical protein [Candidatus Woesearchaeota archaeon]
MVTKEELGQLISEFESLRDMTIEELTKIRTDLETVKEDFEDLKRELEGSAKISLKKRIG